MSTSIPVTNGLFAGDSKPALIGSACPACGAHFFPRRAHCPNPVCGARALEEVRLGTRGTLYSYTMQAYRPPPLFRMDSWAPYVLGLVELPEGVRVLAMLTGFGAERPRIGISLELVLETLFRDSEGRDVLTYKFKPLATEESR
jgi:uncharacterized OB-fold protein